MTHRIADLSEGQKCKTLLAGLILSDPDVLVLDEPTRNLSPLSGPQLRQILRDYKGAVLSVSHDRLFIGEVVDTVYELSVTGLHRIE
jgi:ATPase subunit of ABC transporter with duplicated ATPase domains